MTCIPHEYRCDCNEDCTQYLQVCPSRYFPCQGGDVTCIPHEYRCDCNKDCTDGSDESTGWALCTEQIIYYCASSKAIGK